MRLFLLILSLAASLSAQPTAAAIALTHATVIDGTGAAPLPDQTILIRNGIIASVGPSTAPVPAGAQVEDLTGKFVIPGLIDAHVHIADHSGDIAHYRELLGALLRNGITGIRDMAGDARILGYLAREARIDAPGWPDIYYSALMAGPSFFYEDPRVADTSRGVLLGTAPWLRAIDETTDLRLAVAEAKGTGATGIKLYANLPASLVKAVTAEAHRQGLLVWTHSTIFPAKPSEIVEAGADVVSHTPYLIFEAEPRVPADYNARGKNDFTRIRPDDPKITALLAQMKEHGTILDATLHPFQKSAAKGILPWTYAVTRAAHQAGIPVDAGTDSNGAAPALIEELSLLVKECGFTPLEAIQSATQVSAMAVGQSARRGTIAPTMAADLVVLSADPSEDIANLRKIVAVYKDGRK